MTDAPDREQWLGHWYLLATWDGLLNRWPRIITIEMMAVPEGDTKIRFFADNLTPTGRSLRTAALTPPSVSGALSWRGRHGATRLAPSWDVCHNDAGTLMAALVRPSLLVPGGGLILARAELPHAAAIAGLHSSGSEMGLLPRHVNAMSFRERPDGMLPGGSERLRHFMATAKRGRRAQKVRIPL